MPSQVDICNLALANLGDSATVASIDPPEGSAQAEHCARFYPIALATMLETHDWSFSTRRGALTAAPSNPSSTWSYAYVLPAGIIRPIAVLNPAAGDDYSEAFTNGMGGNYTPQPYVTEALADGTKILLTNQADAVLRYSTTVTDTAKFTPLFVEALVSLLEAKLAGPVIKGEPGRAASKAALQAHAYWVAKAKASDGGSRNVTPEAAVGWLSAR
ncbi:hypothetical protein [Rhodoferax sp.]|uniref:hypothetical protein n=1 Tax=Rhodoferax sp. TaxID=50421 RepID=UPI002ACEFBA7|nr:hypothetical protein [Rhodoferax sp.]MDZ7918513.1 hypothetical protein [Rhodoferax sp.]